ncbi:MHYT domain-containing protein [Actinacidiphila glaucinigra]|uniref:MHYT domain-containing protein n=1 Tax=Actinacidiphila glaucinigra TaxID=235986 RepID=UPI0034045AD9
MGDPSRGVDGGLLGRRPRAALHDQGAWQAPFATGRPARAAFRGNRLRHPASGIRTVHFSAVTGFATGGPRIPYDMPVTFASLVVATVVVELGVFSSAPRFARRPPFWPRSSPCGRRSPSAAASRFREGPRERQ